MSGMEEDFALQVQMACDDLYCDPFDDDARARMRQLLATNARAMMSAFNYRRRVRIACDELHDCPTNIDAQHVLLILMAAEPGVVGSCAPQRG